MNALTILNLALAFLAVILFLNLVMPLETITGNLIYDLDSSVPRCYFKNIGDINEIPLLNCCIEIQKQMACEKLDAQNGIKCYNSWSSERYYLVNNKVINYCEKEGYDVKKE